MSKNRMDKLKEVATKPTGKIIDLTTGEQFVEIKEKKKGFAQYVTPTKMPDKKYKFRYMVQLGDADTGETVEYIEELQYKDVKGKNPEDDVVALTLRKLKAANADDPTLLILGIYDQMFRKLYTETG